jgi:hypothetical protein
MREMHRRPGVKVEVFCDIVTLSKGVMGGERYLYGEFVDVECHKGWFSGEVLVFE